MFSIGDTVEIYVCLSPTDMRRSFDSLAGSVVREMGKNPLSGHLFVFINKRGSMMKILFWDRTGYCQYYKRLENGSITVPLPGSDDTRSVSIALEELRLILDGVDIWGFRKK